MKNFAYEAKEALVKEMGEGGEGERIVFFFSI